MDFLFGPEDYNPFQLRKQDQKDVRAEYTRLRNAAMKRLKRIEAAGLSSPTLVAYMTTTYKPVSKIYSDAGVRAALSALYKWLGQEGSTVAGQRAIRERSMKAFEFYGIKWVTYGNMAKVRLFLDSAKAGAYGANVGSPDAIDYLVALKSEPDSIEELEKGFSKWLVRDTKYGNKK